MYGHTVSEADGGGRKSYPSHKVGQFPAKTATEGEGRRRERERERERD